MTDLVHNSEEEKRGIAYAGGAYVIWGLMPLFWELLVSVPPVEVALHRVVWCGFMVGIATLARGRLSTFLQILRSPRLIGALTVSSILISLNWGIFMYAVQVHRLVETSFGYFVTPLISMAMGVLLLKEKISRVRLAAMALALVAVVFKAAQLGQVPWIAMTLSVSFAFYGFIRKQTPVDPLDGLTAETLLLLPFALIWLGAAQMNGSGAFVADGAAISALLILGGLLTAFPLAMFAAGARRVRMSTLGFLQYLTPSITLILAVTQLGESFTPLDAMSFGSIWTALLLVSLEAPLSRLVGAR